MIVKHQGGRVRRILVDRVDGSSQGRPMAWDVEGTDEFADWYGSLDQETQDDDIAAVAKLEERGPGLGRPLVDTIKGSLYPNMKELRPLGGNIRILFAFDPRRTAILLLGGDKTHRWTEWYEQMIPVADRLYGEYLDNRKKEGTTS